MFTISPLISVFTVILVAKFIFYWIPQEGLFLGFLHLFFVGLCMCEVLFCFVFACSPYT